MKKYRCSKCDDKIVVNFIVEGGISHPFCDYCYEKLQSAPKNNTHLQDFLSMDKREWIERNMKLAKEQRDRGENPWNYK